MTGELGAEALAIFKLPLITFEAEAGEIASTDSLPFRLATLLTATMFFPLLAAKLFPPADRATAVGAAAAEVDDEVGVMMTKVGPLGVGLEVCMTAVAAALLVEEATTSGNCGAGGLGEDLNLLSRMESNSANCSIVLDDIDLTIVCPTDFTVLLPASSEAPVLEEDEEAVEIIVEEGSEGRVVVAAVVTMTLEGAVVIPKA